MQLVDLQIIACQFSSEDFLTARRKVLENTSTHWGGLEIAAKKASGDRQRQAVEQEPKREETINKITNLLERYKRILNQAENAGHCPYSVLRIAKYPSHVSPESRIASYKVWNSSIHFVEGHWGFGGESPEWGMQEASSYYDDIGTFRKIIMPGIGGVELENEQDEDYFKHVDILTLIALADAMEKSIRESIPEGVVIEGETAQEARWRLEGFPFDEHPFDDIGYKHMLLSRVRDEVFQKGERYDLQGLVG